MTKQVKAALMLVVVALLFVALEARFRITTGLAGVFVMGMAGGLLIGHEMAKSAKAAS